MPLSQYGNLAKKRALSRHKEDGDEDSQNSESSLSLCHRMLICSVAELIQERKIIFVPDRSLNQVPFAALSDKKTTKSTYPRLSESSRLIQTLKLIQDSHADYHSQTWCPTCSSLAGDKDVGRMLYKGSKKLFSRLPEAAMIGRLLCVQPLSGH